MPEAVASELRSTTDVDEFILTEKRLRGTRRSLGGDKTEHSYDGRTLDAHIFIDSELGRGHSHFSVPANALLAPLIQDSKDRAHTALGPPWRLSPPSAPARLELSDKDWAQNAPASLRALEEEFRSRLPASMKLIAGHVQLERSNTRVIVSNGFDNEYQGTLAVIQARLLAPQGRAITATIRARRGQDLRWESLFENAEKQNLLGASPASAESGECDLLLMAPALAANHGNDYGLWTPLVAQSSAHLAAAGMARYQLGQEILQAPAIGDALTIRSDGSKSFALRSAPFDNEGQAVRRFPLVEAGRAAGQGVDYRAAARLGRDANGGVRNLVVDSGMRTLAELREPGERPLLVVHSLSKLYAEARGGLSLRIARAEWRTRDKAGVVQSKAIRSGVVCGNLYQWLREAHFSAEREDLLWYEGPRGLRFDRLRLQA